MVDARFYEYVSELLNRAGHMITSTPIYTNHSASETLYIDSNKDVTTNRFDRTMLMQLDNVSLLTKITWPGVVEELTETVHIYSISIDVPNRNRSQIVADSFSLRTGTTTLFLLQIKTNLTFYRIGLIYMLITMKLLRELIRLIFR